MGSRAVPHVNVHRAALPKVARVGCVQAGPSTRGAAQTCSWLCVYIKKKSRIRTVKAMQEELRYYFCFLTKVGSAPIN